MAADSMSPFVEADISMRMSIPPGDVDSASGFVHRALEQCVHKYRQEFGGVMLAYDNDQLGEYAFDAEEASWNPKAGDGAPVRAGDAVTLRVVACKGRARTATDDAVGKPAKKSKKSKKSKGSAA
ncbi:hypothetical protein FNF28_02631 [Cafeteria roenbergensis]|uniref:Uncharacterized protein n=1 Tax=Cafeteria roenbergensis TaxID=33653 RepID=A0A5A8DS28_CAFRO|nr:hypothetical protein FNF28_02631 [Cafeteria roenbergensis]